MHFGRRHWMSITTNRTDGNRQEFSNRDKMKNRQRRSDRFFHGWSVCLIAIGLVLVVGGCSLWGGERTHYADRVEQKMGTDFRIQLYARDAEEADRVLDAAFARLDELNHSWSDYDEESELSRLEQTAGSGEWVGLSDELATLVEAGLKAWEWTDGSFDLTGGPVIQLWRVSRRTDRLPREEELEEAMDRTGSEYIRYDSDNQRIMLLKEGMQLDPGGIGKGLAADLLMRFLKEEGIERALIDAGGDLLASGPPPDAEAWEVWLEQPSYLSSGTGSRSIRLNLADRAVATSGDLFQFSEIEGIRYSHIVDLSTGAGVVGHHQATVIAPKAWQADLYATVLILEGMQIENHVPEGLDLDYLLLRKIDLQSDLMRWESGGWHTWLHQGSR